MFDTTRLLHSSSPSVVFIFKNCALNIFHCVMCFLYMFSYLRCFCISLLFILFSPSPWSIVLYSLFSLLISTRLLLRPSSVNLGLSQTRPMVVKNVLLETNNYTGDNSIHLHSLKKMSVCINILKSNEQLSESFVYFRIQHHPIIRW